MKRIGFFCFLGLAALLMIFHQAFLSRLASLVTPLYSISKWGQSLHYDTLSFSDGHLVVSNPHFEHGLTLQAEQADLDFTIDWKRRVLHVSIDLLKPKWDLKQPIAVDSGTWEGMLTQQDGWFKTHFQLHVSNGRLTMPSQIQPALFNIDVDSYEGALIKLHFNPKIQYLIILS